MKREGNKTATISTALILWKIHVYEHKMTKFPILIAVRTHSSFIKMSLGCDQICGEIMEVMRYCMLGFIPVLSNCKCYFVRDVSLWICVHTPWQQAWSTGLQASCCWGKKHSTRGFKEWKNHILVLWLLDQLISWKEFSCDWEGI